MLLHFGLSQHSIAVRVGDPESGLKDVRWQGAVRVGCDELINAHRARSRTPLASRIMCFASVAFEEAETGMGAPALAKHDRSGTAESDGTQIDHHVFSFRFDLKVVVFPPTGCDRGDSEEQPMYRLGAQDASVFSRENIKRCHVSTHKRAALSAYV